MAACMAATFATILAFYAAAYAAPVSAQGELSAKELDALIVGKTLHSIGLKVGNRTKAFVDPGGKFLFESSGRIMSGTWRISPDGGFCVSIVGESCSRVRSNGDGTYTRIRNGVPEAKWLEFSLGNALNTPRDPPGEKITFQSLTFGFENPAPVLPLSVAGRPTEVSGFLALPVADAPLPAMVVMHGCDGISASEIEWAKTLNKLGVATLVVDRYGPRNIAETCTYREFINSASALVDAFRALEVLSTNPRIDPARIGIMGMSLGGQLTLTTSQVRFQERYGKGAATFATYIALYPAGCVTRMIDEERVRGGMIRIFHGAADDWTLIGPCRQYIERLRRASVDAALHEYAGAHHAFDNPALTVTRLNAVRGTGNCTFEERDGKIVDTVTGLGPMSSKCWSQGATVGYNADAHRQVKADIERILSELFKLK